MTPHGLVTLFVGLVMAFAIPGPCSYDSFDELDCDFSAGDATCPGDLVCAPDDHCKPADIACDRVDDAQACNGLCISADEFLEDVRNCGACGNACDVDAGEACCAGDCVRVDVDERCGSCDVACSVPDETCVDAACRASCGVDEDCNADEVCCDLLCNDATLDTRCGGCNVSCSADNNQTCVDQVCRTSCANDGDCAGSRCCDGLCVEEGDPEHCGACDSPCGPDTVCIDDQCAPECAPDRPCTGVNEDCCGGRCVDTRDEDDHCGACDAPCGGSLFCDGGTCHDGTEQDCCGPACVDCPTARVCRAGQCASCNFLAQDCGPSRTCIPDSSDSLSGQVELPTHARCVDARVSPARHEECVESTTNGGCAEASHCRVLFGGTARCVGYCDRDLDVSNCTPDELCVAGVVAVGPFFGDACLPRCDLSSFTCTIAGVAGTCTPADAGTGQCTTGDGVCVPPTPFPIGEGQACGGVLACGEGLACTHRGESLGTCERLCVDVGTACVGGGTCEDTMACPEIGTCSQ